MKTTEEKLIRALEDYIKLMGEEISALVGLAHVHGWKSTRAEKGKKMREKIMKLKKEMAK